MTKDQIQKAGIGVMVSYLSGNEDSVSAFTGAIGKTISKLALSDTSLRLEFEDSTPISFYDDGQSCCESRYMRTDDRLDDFVGAKLTGAEIKTADNLASEYGDHEIQFLEIKTDKGPITMSNHNEHNGYYGGFAIRVMKA